MSRGLGYVKDAPDPKDRPIGALLGARAAAPIPPSADLRNPVVMPKDQGGTSSCTGQSTSQALRLAVLKAGVECPELSALFPYFVGRAETGDQERDEGSTIRNVLKAVMRFGCPDESAWPFSEGSVNAGPGHSAYRSAFDRRGVRGYYRIQVGDLTAIRTALAHGYPVVGGWQVSESFLEWDGGEPIGLQVDNIVGGHALPIVQYGEDGTFQLLNSWGSGWGRDGYAVVTENFVRQGTDLWAVETGT